jgi:hypothetical protein
MSRKMSRKDRVDAVDIPGSERIKPILSCARIAPIRRQ